MGSIALVLVQSHQSACALQIYLTRAPLACPDLAAAQFTLRGPFSAPWRVRGAPETPRQRSIPANARKSEGVSHEKRINRLKRKKEGCNKRTSQEVTHLNTALAQAR